MLRLTRITVVSFVKGYILSKMQFVCLLAAVFGLFEPSVVAKENVSTVDLDLVRNRVGNVQVELDMGALTPGGKAVSAVRLRNLTGKDLEFDSLDIGCGCLSVTPMKGLIPVGETFEFRVELTSVDTPTKTESTQGFAAMLKRQPVFSLRANIKYTDIIAFVDRHLVAEIPRGSNSYSFDLPILLGESFSPGDAVISLEGELSVLDANIHSKEKVVRCTANTTKFGGGERTGRIRLQHKITGQSSSIEVSVGVQPAFKLHPLFILFRKAENSDCGRVAYVAVSTEADNNDFEDKPISIKFRFGDTPIPATVLRRKGRMVWLEIPFPSEKLGDTDRGHLHCEVQSGGLSEIFSVPFSVQSNLLGVKSR